MFSVIHLDGSSDTTSNLESLSDVLGELDNADREHGDVAIVHEETGWSMSAHSDGRLVFEHLSEGGERHMKPVPRNRIIQLWRLLANGEIDALLREPWRPGYGR